MTNPKRNHTRRRRSLGFGLLVATGLILVASLQAQGPQARLVLPNGQTFHTTANPVHELRTVEVPGSALQLYLWEEELPTGEHRMFYAVGQAGVRLRGRVRATTYKVRLRHHHFDPLLHDSPAVAPALSARSHNRLCLVQFVTTPLPEYRQAITAVGGKVLRFLADHTFIVEMTPGVHAQVAQLPYVRWIGPYQPEYRLEKPLRDAIEDGAPLETQRYSILLTERGAEFQAGTAMRIEALGGTVEMLEPGGLRLEATLTREQLLEVAHDNAVQFIDRWGGPGELDMDIVRQVGGADYLEGVELWTGQGVRGEIFDSELRTSHQEWAAEPIIHAPGSAAFRHGTSCYSINFAQGENPEARGMLPSGQGIFFPYNQSTQFGGTISRYQINQELIDPAGPYWAVFQTASVGSTPNTEYTTISAEVDDYLFLYPLLSTQSQSNTCSPASRPQAWAKNIVAVGGIYHHGTADRCDDHWYESKDCASTGPAADGRIKPDLAFFYDGIRAASALSDTAYTDFGGTSAATPATAGHFGLLFQMWHEGVWSGHGGGTDVFDSRPQMATGKALMINMAYRYDWTSPGGCAYSDVDRFVQGWGTADVRRLYDRAPVTSIVDETYALAPLETKVYRVLVEPRRSELNVTLVYTDPMGTVGAAYARINDLSLKVISPSGTVYWGNHGLEAGNFSIPGGSSDTVNTVENVFIPSPQAGTWTVDVIGDEIVADAHLETPELDAVYALVVSGGLIQWKAEAYPVGTDGSGAEGA